MNKICKHHGIINIYTQCYKTKENGNIVYRCKKCNTAKVLKRAKKLRNLILDLEGRKCLLCSYNKCEYSLHFHHLNPTIKKFGLTAKFLRSRSIKRVLQELDKCILVCANCHGEIEQGLIDIQLCTIANKVKQRSVKPKNIGSNPICAVK